jgi:pyruvate dehydrogenase complex dehydrogenase (E1) component
MNTPYTNTISPENHPEYPGDREIERRSLHPVECHGDGREREPTA